MEANPRWPEKIEFSAWSVSIEGFPFFVRATNPCIEGNPRNAIRTGYKVFILAIISGEAAMRRPAPPKIEEASNESGYWPDCVERGHL